MLSPDVKVEGFSAEEWLRLGHVFSAPGAGARAENGPRGGVVALTSDGRLRKLLSTRVGRLDPSSERLPLNLQELAARHDASWAVELATGALDLLADRFAERLRREDTYLSQVLVLLLVLRELEANGHLRVWPWPIADWPIPTERAVVRALDALCPVGRVALLGVFSRGELYTAIAARRGAQGIEALVGPEELRREMGVPSGDWQRDYRFLSEAATRIVGPLALGCFAELFTFQSLATAPPGSWASAVAGRDVILSPASPGVALPVGLDAGRAVWASVRGLAERYLSSEWLDAASRLRPSKEFGLPFEDGVKAWLGFDPLRLLSRLMARAG